MINLIKKQFTSKLRISPFFLILFLVLFQTSLRAEAPPAFDQLLTIGESDDAEVRIDDVTIASNGDKIIVGHFYNNSFDVGVDFDPFSSEDRFDTGDVGAYSMFITKLNANGSYAWTKVFGGSDTDFYDVMPSAISLDSNNNIYVTGSFTGTVDFNPNSGVDSRVANLDYVYDYFITKINANGSYGWTKSIGSTAGRNIITTSIKVSSDGFVWVAGEFSGEDPVDFNPGTGQDLHSSHEASTDIFFSKYRTNGTYIETWTTQAEEYSSVTKPFLTLDHQNKIILTGSIYGFIDFNSGINEDIYAGFGLFVSKFNSNGSNIWTKTVDLYSSVSSNDKYFSQAAVDSNNDLFIVGDFFGITDFNPSDSEEDLHDSTGYADMFILKLSSDGSYGWTKTIGGNYDNCTSTVFPKSLYLDQGNRIFLGGVFQCTVDFNPGDAEDLITSHYDGFSINNFITKLDQNGDYSWTRTLIGDDGPKLSNVWSDVDGNAFVSGYFENETDFDPGVETNLISPFGLSAAYLLKLKPQLQVEVSVVGDGDVNPSGTTYYTRGANQVFAIIPNAGSHIQNVIVDGVSVGVVTSYPFNNMQADHTILANFAAEALTITASANPNGMITPSGVMSVERGSSRTFTITPNTGYHIADVVVDGVSQGATTSYTFLNITQNHTIMASFSIDTFTVTSSAGPNGIITPNATVNVNFGSNLTYTITANAGYHIADVLVNGVSVGAVSEYSITNIQQNTTIAASFAIDSLTIIASAGPNGNITPNGSVAADRGSNVTFTITPNVGYHIATVLVNGVSQGTIDRYTFFNIQQNSSITASFSIDTFTITALSATGGTITPNGNISVNRGASQTFNISANDTFVIKNVWVDGRAVGAVTSYTFNNVQANHTITPSFKSTAVITPVRCDQASNCPVSQCQTVACVEHRCVYQNETGNTCNDDNLCTINDTCSNGVCLGQPKDCSALNDQCNAGICVQSTGQCTRGYAHENEPCQDGLFCTVSERCYSGVCEDRIRARRCTQYDTDCTRGACNEVTRGCQINNVNEGRSCSDGKYCTLGETCRAGACSNGTPVDCSSLDDQCNKGVCNEKQKTCLKEASNTGLSCNDGNLCTLGEICSEGKCKGNPVDCNDHHRCTLDRCDPENGMCRNSSIPGCTEG